ncbi:MAG: 3'-5' exonuclease [Candidatus Riflebacteria bacterium]|nr:3'-5' exonuclease [Candidatus Riflebacteria bacterium]
MNDRFEFIKDTPVRDLPFAIIDLETTGYAPPYAKITEISVISLYSKPEVYIDTLVDPGVSIPREIVELTGIDNSMVKGKPKIDAIAEKISESLDNRIFVSHNVPFDLAFIKHVYANCLKRDFSVPSLCTLHLSRKYLKLPSNALGSVAKHLSITTTGAHRAMADTLTVKHLLHHFVEMFEGMGLKTGADLIKAGLIKAR